MTGAGVGALPLRHETAWGAVTRHPFLVGVRDGTLAEAAFDAWLVEDSHFVSDLLRFQARLLARAPRSAQAVLAAGLTALVDELTWFEEQAAARRLTLATAPAPATAAYAALLARFDAAEPGVALAALWAIERAYLDAWSYAAPGAPAYREFVGHWTTPAFAAYVDELARAADDVAGPAERAVEAAFLEVLDAETRFWPAADEHRPGVQR